MSAATERARQLLANATPGPWRHVSPLDGTIHRVVTDVDPEFPFVLLRMDDTGYSKRSSWDQRAADAELIAAAPGIIADLLNELDARTNPELAARLLRITQTTGCIDQACDCDECSDLRAAARMIGDTPRTALAGRCPTCHSDDRRTYRCDRGCQPGHIDLADPWHNET